MNDCDRLITHLERVNWQRTTLPELDGIAAVLTQTDPQCVLDRFRDVLRAEEYAPHHEFPRPIMDKFVLFIDPQDRFRVRLHRFKTRTENRGIEPWIHDHRWAFVSVILAGSYTEEVFEVVDSDEHDFAAIQLSSSHLLLAGATNRGLPRIPHRTTNHDSDISCYTLFVRGPSVCDYSRIFDPDRRTFSRSWGLKRELEEQYLRAERDILG